MERLAEAPILWLPDAKSQLIGKDPHTGGDWRQMEKRLVKDEMVRWHHWFNGHKFEQTLGDSGGQKNMLQSTESQRPEHDFMIGQQKIRHL